MSKVWITVFDFYQKFVLFLINKFMALKVMLLIGVRTARGAVFTFLEAGSRFKFRNLIDKNFK